ncbi:MAG: hypothetical protein LBU77_05060 [Clostridiales bacterium]|jgi:hypothetical protein|nr:hypothetical protein [Clostridiales bacterium]
MRRCSKSAVSEKLPVDFGGRLWYAEGGVFGDSHERHMGRFALRVDAKNQVFVSFFQRNFSCEGFETTNHFVYIQLLLEAIFPARGLKRHTISAVTILGTKAIFPARGLKHHHAPVHFIHYHNATFPARGLKREALQAVLIRKKRQAVYAVCLFLLIANAYRYWRLCSWCGEKRAAGLLPCVSKKMV